MLVGEQHGEPTVDARTGPRGAEVPHHGEHASSSRTYRCIAPSVTICRPTMVAQPPSRGVLRVIKASLWPKLRCSAIKHSNWRSSKRAAIRNWPGDERFERLRARNPLVPPDAAQLERFLARAQAIATAVEERYAKLLPAVTSDPVFEDPLLEHVRAIVVEDAPTHTASLVDLRTLLPDGVPAGLLRATRRQASNAFEQRMLDASDRIYDLVLSTLREQFEHTDFFVARSFRSLAERDDQPG